MSPTSLRLRFLQASNTHIAKTFSVLLVLALFPTSLTAATLLLVTGSGEGQPSLVRIYQQGISATPSAISFQPYRSSFRGGVRVAVGDINGDGLPEVITAPGPGMEPLIQVFNGNTGKRLPGPIGSFLALPGNFRGGLFVAAGDVNGDGKEDIIVGPDTGMLPIVRVFDGTTGNTLRSFFAYSPGFLGGVRVASGDVNGDGVADIITGAGPGAGPHVKVFNGATFATHKSFFAESANFAGGVYVAAGDVNGDGKADIIVGAGPGGGPHVKVFDAVSTQVLPSFFAFDTGFNGGVRVAMGDVNGDGKLDIINGTGPGGGPHVIVYDSQTRQVLHSFFAYDASFQGGVFVAGNN